MEKPIQAGEWPFIGTIVLLDGVSEFSRAITGAEPRIVPRIVFRVLGDVLSLAGIRFPITSSRFASMTQDYPTPMDESLAVLGRGPTHVREGVSSDRRLVA